MATFLPHLLVQLVALFTASGGLFLLTFSEWSGLIFAVLFIFFQVCLHFFILSTNSLVPATAELPLRVLLQVVQSAFIVLGLVALGILFWWLEEWCFFKIYNEPTGGSFYFNIHGVLLSLVPPLVEVGVLGEVIRQLYPYFKLARKLLQKYFTTWS